MTVISQQVLVEAVRCVERMPFKERERLADELYLRQPHLLACVLVLHQFGISLAQMEVVINLLMVCHEAMKHSGKTWPLITEDDQDLCMTRLLARMQFSEGMTEQQQTQATADAVADHPEQQLLAYAYGTLKRAGLASYRKRGAQDAGALRPEPGRMRGVHRAEGAFTSATPMNA